MKKLFMVATLLFVLAFPVIAQAAHVDSIIIDRGREEATVTNNRLDTNVTQTESTDYDVDVVKVGGNSVAINSGTNSDGTQRVTIATDDEINNDLDTIATNSTTIAGDTTAIETAVELMDDDLDDIRKAVEIMDDWDDSDVCKIGGGIAEDSASTAKPVHVGGIAETTVPTGVADADAIGIWVDEYGRLVLKGANLSEGSLDVTPIAAPPVDSGYVVVADVTLDASPTSATSTVFIGDKSKVTIFLNAVMDWTDSNPDLDLDLKLEGSADNSTFYDLDNVIDATGVDSPVGSVISLALSAGDTDTTYEKQYHIPDYSTMQYLKVTATATNSDADDTIVLDVIVCYQK